MLKFDEIRDPKSCFNRARGTERIFILLARDAAAPFTIRQWAEERIRLGKNKRDDAQIKEALECADLMEGSGPFEPDIRL
jgi:hypothetical protein